MRSLAPGTTPQLSRVEEEYRMKDVQTVDCKDLTVLPLSRPQDQECTQTILNLLFDIENSCSLQGFITATSCSSASIARVLSYKSKLQYQV